MMIMVKQSATRIEIPVNWESLCGVLEALLRDGSDEAREGARIEMRKMAKAADLYNEAVKAGKFTKRPYFHLLQKTRGGRWTIEFGDFSREVVESELEDYNSNKRTGTTFKIVQTDGTQDAIEARVAELNAKL
jgi:hypothetical protein